MDFVKANETLTGINTLINIASGAIFGFLPLAVAYSACKRFGGRPILGIVMGCIMLSGSLTDAYAAAQGGSHNFTYIRSGRPARGISGRYYCSFTDGICDGEIRSFL